MHSLRPEREGSNHASRIQGLLIHCHIPPSNMEPVSKKDDGRAFVVVVTLSLIQRQTTICLKVTGIESDCNVVH